MDRARVLAYRVAAQGLDRSADPFDSSVFDLGFQDTPTGNARLALAARTGSVWADDRTTTVWSIRGAPHVVRSGDLAALTTGLWPADEKAARSLLSWTGKRVDEAGMPAVAAIGEVASAAAAVVEKRWPGRKFDGHALSKSELSSEVTALVPPGLTLFCAGCNATHVHEQLLRLGGLPGGVALTGSPTAFVPLASWDGVPAGLGDPSELVAAYLRLHGPATVDDAAAFLGVTSASVRPFWPDGVPVYVDGREAWILPECLSDLQDAEVTKGVRLLPPGDPLLQGRDRGVLVPDAAQRKSVWKAIGSPGVVLIDSDIVGLWRPKASGKKLTITVETFRTVKATEKKAIGVEAELVAEVRGLGSVKVEFS